MEKKKYEPIMKMLCEYINLCGSRKIDYLIFEQLNIYVLHFLEILSTTSTLLINSFACR